MNLQIQNGKYKDYNLLRFCIELEVAKSHNCDCVPVGCDVLKTVYELPEYLQTPYHSSIKVRTLGGKIIGKTSDEALLTELTDPIKGSAIRWTLNSNKIVIWRNLDLKAIEVEAVWADPLDWDEKRLCPDPNGNDCGDALDLDAGVTQDQSRDIMRMCMKDLGFSLPLQDDRTADRNPER